MDYIYTNLELKSTLLRSFFLDSFINLAPVLSNPHFSHLVVLEPAINHPILELLVFDIVLCSDTPSLRVTLIEAGVVCIHRIVLRLFHRSLALEENHECTTDDSTEALGGVVVLTDI